MTCSSTLARIAFPSRHKAAAALIGALLALALVGGGLTDAFASASSGRLSARLSKTSFTSSQAGSVKLKYKFSKRSATFSYLLTFKKGSKWQKVKSVKKKGAFRGSKSMSVKKVFAGKAVKLGSYRLQLGCDYGKVKLSFKVVPAAKPAIKRPSGSKPANTSLPTISGTTAQGQTLTASNGSWSQSPTSYARQWRRCDSSGANCSDLSGANSGSYLLASADVGHTLRVVVTASNSNGSASASSSQTAVVSGPPGRLPANTALPTITGTTTQGQTLTAHNGSWNESPISFSYQWQRCNSGGSGCSSIAGAASSEYVLTYDDAGHTLRVVVTASNSYGSASATSLQSPALGTVMGLRPANIDPPTISGDATEGVRLTANHGSWSNLPSYTYRWQRCESATDCQDISGATASSYALVAGDVGRTIRLVVTATNPYGSKEAVSAPTAVVEAASPLTDSGWVWQNPLPQGNPLAAVDFVNTSDGWTVGSGGTILASKDGGTSWETQGSPTTSALYAVSFTSATRGWIADASGTVLSTDDGGANWNEHKATGTTKSLNGIDFVDSDYGWAVGSAGTILRTENGGTSWTRQKSDPNLDLYGVSFVSRTEGWAVGSLWDGDAGDQYGVIYVTNDGGDSWDLQYPKLGDTPRAAALQSVQFVDSLKGRAVGDTGTVLTTKDGGTSWVEWYPGGTDSFLSTSFANPSDPAKGWAVSWEGTIFKTTDSGDTWSPQNSGTTSNLNGVDFVDATHGWAVGGGGAILRTTDGVNWSSILTSADDDLSASLTSVAFANSIDGWAADASGTILNTTNGGSSWAKQYGASRGALSYAGVDFANASDGWAVGAAGAIFATGDGGGHWNAQSSHSSEDLAAVSSVGSDAWAVGAEGTILSNKDGSWNVQTSPVGSELNAVSFTDADHGWIADASGTVLSTGNGGGSWTPRGTPTTESLNGIDFLSDSLHGWVVGDRGVIAATSNGGETWIDESYKGLDPNPQLYAVDFVDSLHGWAVGSRWDKSIFDDRGVVLHTGDGGSNWTPQNLPDVGQLRSVQFANLNDGCAVGADGTVLVTSTGGSSWTARKPGASDFFSGVSFVSATRGWAVSAEGTILTTSNGGDDWQAQSSVNDNSIFGLAFAGLDNGWAVGSHYDAVTGERSGLILSTIDGGRDWSELTTATSRRLNSVETVDGETHAWAVGAKGTILSNKSGSWQVKASPVGSDLNAVSFTNPNHGWIADASGTILATGDGGESWNEHKATGTTRSLNGIDFVDEDYGWAVGDEGVIIASTNGGWTWTAQDSHLSTPLSAVKFADRSHGWAVGAGGVILVTSDGGSSWIPQFSRTTQSLFAVDFVVPGGSDPGYYGWVVGERGTILATATGGVPSGP
ncbi:MAG: YCF48-related protein [Gaiellaceae bacterium]